MPRSSPRLRIAFIPSVSGGLGHVTRLARLARALRVALPTASIVFVLPELRLRPVNVEAVKGLGYPVRLLPNPVRHERDDVVTSVLGDVDVVIEDTERRLIAYRRILPRARLWISIPMLPLWDELFLDWTLLEHADHILYTYPDVMPVPAELERFKRKVTVTGPFVEAGEFPSRASARRRLHLGAGDALITYAPRGFPFGRPCGRRVLNAVVGGTMRVNAARGGTSLVLTGVPDIRAIQPPRLPPLSSIDGVLVMGMLPRRELGVYLAAADVSVVEGTSGLFDAAMAGTPVVMVPGPIYETTVEADWVAEHDAGIVVRPDEITRSTMARSIDDILAHGGPAAARAERLRTLVGAGGEQMAVKVIVDQIARTAR
jgi:hypothetical protein